MPLGFGLGKRKGHYELSRDLFVLSVCFPDKDILQCTLSHSSVGRECMDYIAGRLKLLQPGYFGLRYKAKRSDTFRWLDLEKCLWKQLQKFGETHLLYFAILFYAPDARLLTDEVARYFYFVEINSFVLEGRLPVSPDKALLLAAYCLQIMLGDYDEQKHTLDLLKSFEILPKFLTNSDKIWEDLLCQVIAAHKGLRGLSSSDACLLYIAEAQHLEGYGEETVFPAKDDRDPNNRLVIGYSVGGILVKTVTLNPLIKFAWEDVVSIIANKRYFCISCKEMANIHYQMEDIETAKYAAQICNMQHQFYLLQSKLSIAALGNCSALMVNKKNGTVADRGEYSFNFAESSNGKPVPVNNDPELNNNHHFASVKQTDGRFQLNNGDYVISSQSHNFVSNGFADSCLLSASQPIVYASSLANSKCGLTASEQSIARKSPNGSSDCLLNSSACLPAPNHCGPLSSQQRPCQTVRECETAQSHDLPVPPKYRPTPHYLDAIHRPSLHEYHNVRDNSLTFQHQPNQAGHSASTQDLPLSPLPVANRPGGCIASYCCSNPEIALFGVTNGLRELAPHATPCTIPDSNASVKLIVNGRGVSSISTPNLSNDCAPPSRRIDPRANVVGGSAVLSATFVSSPPGVGLVLPCSPRDVTLENLSVDNLDCFAPRSTSSHSSCSLQQRHSFVVACSTDLKAESLESASVSSVVNTSEGSFAILKESPQNIRECEAFQRCYRIQQHPLRECSQSNACDSSAFPNFSHSSALASTDMREENHDRPLQSHSNPSSNDATVAATTLSRADHGKAAQKAVARTKRHSAADVLNDSLAAVESKDHLARIDALLRDESALSAEFESLTRLRASAGTSTALKEENAARNRSPNILPYEDTRVRLQPSVHNPTGYINASHVMLRFSPETVVRYIATQDVLESTMADFWQMIWESRVNIIVMISQDAKTAPAEAACFPYWPRQSEQFPKLRCDNFQISFQFSTQSPTASHVTTSLCLKHIPSNQKLHVYHLNYLNWPSVGAPDDAASFLSFIDELASVRRHFENEQRAADSYLRYQANNSVVGRNGFSNENAGSRFGHTSAVRLNGSNVSDSSSDASHSVATTQGSWKKNWKLKLLPDLHYFSSDHHRSGSSSSRSLSKNEELLDRNTGVSVSRSGFLGAPVVVHCANGAGASGVLILLEMMIYCLEHNHELDVPWALCLIRQQRMHMIDSIVQYRFVYECLFLFLKKSRLI